MNPQRILGTLLLVAGVMFLIIGINASNSAADRWSNFFSGHFTDNTMWSLIGGGASAVAGLMLLTFGGRRIAA